MDYFSKFLRSSTQSVRKQPYDHAAEFHRSWTIIKETLEHPDERQLAKGIRATEVPTALKSMVDSLVWESTRMEEGLTGACMEYLLKNDVLGMLVRLSEMDRPSGIQVEVLRTVQNMVVLLDEQFLVHAAVHRAVLRLLRTCVGDDIQEQLDGRRVMGAAGNAMRALPSEYEEDLVDLLCLLCSRIRNFRELLIIFFYDKHWYSEVTSTHEDDDDDDEMEVQKEPKDSLPTSNKRAPSPSPSQASASSAPLSPPQTKKPEYEFILFNYLLRFVHREGRIGDFARAGLLFLMDVAMSPGIPINHLGGDGSKLPASSYTNFSPSSATSGSDPIVDVALALAEYILDGDFCEVLGAGLAAVYSLLPSKLEVHMDFPDNGSSNTTMTIGYSMPLSEEEREQRNVAREKARANGTEYSSSPEFKARIDHFVKLLEFLQDVMRRNISSNEDNEVLEPVSSAIVQSILDAVRRIFLENVLYPSILECSDADGSAVAVMSYIDVMIRTLQDHQFAETLVDFLVSEDDTDFSRRRPRVRTTTLLLDGTSLPDRQSTSSPIHPKRASRRKSSAMMLLEMEAPEARRQSEYLTSLGRFTLKDLLHANLRSPSKSTVTAAVELLQSLLTYQCHLTADRLLLSSFEPMDAVFSQPRADEKERVTFPGADIEPIQAYGSQPSTGREEKFYLTHERELNLYLGLVGQIDPTHSHGAFSTGYEHYLKDAITALASHACSTCVSHMDYANSRHRLSIHDPLLSSILQSLRHFYANVPELNMSLTGVLAAIASCPARSLWGWLLFGSDISLGSPKLEQKLFQFSNDGDDRSVDYEVNERLGRNEQLVSIPEADPSTLPVILSILQGLVSNLDRFRELVPGFDSFLSERRQGLVFSENLTDALSLTFDLSNRVSGISDIAAAAAHSGVGSSRECRDCTSSPPASQQKPKVTRSLATTWAAFLSPRKGGSGSKESSTSAPSSAPLEHEPESSENQRRTIDASPFGLHYQKTRAISVEPLAAQPVTPSDLWAPSKDGRNVANYDEDAVLTSSFARWRDEEGGEDAVGRIQTAVGPEDAGQKVVSLSQLLDNVVILEECIKELAGIIHARRSLSIDPLRFF